MIYHSTFQEDAERMTFRLHCLKNRKTDKRFSHELIPKEDQNSTGWLGCHMPHYIVVQVTRAIKRKNGYLKSRQLVEKIFSNISLYEYLTIQTKPFPFKGNTSFARNHDVNNLDLSRNLTPTSQNFVTDIPESFEEIGRALPIALETLQTDYTHRYMKRHKIRMIDDIPTKMIKNYNNETMYVVTFFNTDLNKAIADSVSAKWLSEQYVENSAYQPAHYSVVVNTLPEFNLLKLHLELEIHTYNITSLFRGLQSFKLF